VVDLGSSTTDFAFIMGGHEVELQTAGEVRLGGGIMDELVLEESVRRSENPEAVRRALEDSAPWRSYCEFAARRLKEQYFSDEEYWRGNDCRKTVRVLTGKDLRLTLRMDEKIADDILNKAAPQLNGKSFRKAFCDSLKDLKGKLGDQQPELLFMATPDGLEEWETESADLFFYAWRGDHAEQILWGGTIFAVAGNGPWYEIYLDADNRGDLYVHFGCDAPGSLNCYRVNEDGQYALVKSTAGYTDYEAETTEYYDGCTYYVDGMVTPKAEYDAAMAEMEVEHKIMIASTEEPIR
jgi:hypothetical protein